MAKKITTINKSTLYDTNLEIVAKEIDNIWGKQDIKRPVLFQWLSVMQHAGAVAEEVRKSAWHNVVHELAEVLVWWLSFISSISRKPNKKDPDLVFHFNIRPSDIVWFKFPNVCPLCFGYELAKLKDIDQTLTNISNYNKKIYMSDLKSVYNSIKVQPCKCMARKNFVENRSKAFKIFVKKNIYTLATT